MTLQKGEIWEVGNICRISGYERRNFKFVLAKRGTGGDWPELMT